MSRAVPPVVAENTSTELATVEGGTVDDEVSRGTDGIESINTEVVSYPSSMTTSLTTDMVISRSRSNKVQRRREETGNAREGEQEIPTYREAIMDFPELDPRVFPPTYGGVKYGSPLRFNGVLREEV